MTPIEQAREALHKLIAQLELRCDTNIPGVKIAIERGEAAIAALDQEGGARKAGGDGGEAHDEAHCPTCGYACEVECTHAVAMAEWRIGNTDKNDPRVQVVDWIEQRANDLARGGNGT